MPITEEQLNYINYIDSLTNKQLTEICRKEQVRQSNNGITNKFVKKLNILSKYLGRGFEDTWASISVLLSF